MTAPKPHSILSDARASLELVGDGDWTPQDSHLVAVLTYAEGLEEQLEAAQAQVGSLDGLYAQAKLRAERAEEQLEAIQERVEEAVSIMPDPMHPHFPPDKVDAQARAIRLLTLEDPYPASEPSEAELLARRLGAYDRALAEAEQSPASEPR